jgi:probable addiction module antidote protein
MSMARKIDPKAFRDNPATIATYLSEILGENDLIDFVRAIDFILRAQNVIALSEETGLRRENLYRMFKGNSDPRLGNTLKVLTAFGLEFAVKCQAVKPKPPQPKLRRKIDPKAFRDNPETIATCLTEVLSENDLIGFVQEIDIVVRAQNVVALSEETGLGRENLYRMFKGDRDPRLGNTLKVLGALGVEFIVKPRTIIKPKPARPKLGRRRSKPVT